MHSGYRPDGPDAVVIGLGEVDGTPRVDDALAKGPRQEAHSGGARRRATGDLRRLRSFPATTRTTPRLRWTSWRSRLSCATLTRSSATGSTATRPTTRSTGSTPEAPSGRTPPTRTMTGHCPATVEILPRASIAPECGSCPSRRSRASRARIRRRAIAPAGRGRPESREIFTRHLPECGVRGNLVPDALLAALALESGCEGEILKDPRLRAVPEDSVAAPSPDRPTGDPAESPDSARGESAAKASPSSRAFQGTGMRATSVSRAGTSRLPTRDPAPRRR